MNGFPDPLCFAISFLFLYFSSPRRRAAFRVSPRPGLPLLAPLRTVFQTNSLPRSRVRGPKPRGATKNASELAKHRLERGRIEYLGLPPVSMLSFAREGLLGRGAVDLIVAVGFSCFCPFLDFHNLHLAPTALRIKVASETNQFHGENAHVWR